MACECEACDMACECEACDIACECETCDVVRDAAHACGNPGGVTRVYAFLRALDDTDSYLKSSSVFMDVLVFASTF